MKSAASLAGVLVLATAGCGMATEDPRMVHSRAIASEFQQSLGSALKGAMAEGGPVHALDVCQQQAPAIADAVSTAHGAEVGRTALRVRNPANAPDEEATAVLKEFQARLAAGEAAPEHFERRDGGSARYMKAIVMQPMCTVCHGAALAEPVAQDIAARYPEDEATGFEPGELRGAFLIEWPGGELP